MSTMKAFWQDIPTDAVRRAAARYERPLRSNVLNDPYIGSPDSMRCNHRFQRSLSRYRSRSLGPIVAAAQGDIAWLRSHRIACQAWAGLYLVVAALILLFVGLSSWVALVALVPVAAAWNTRGKLQETSRELAEAEAFYAHLQGWVLQLKLASVGSRAANRAVAA